MLDEERYADLPPVTAEESAAPLDSANGEIDDADSGAVAAPSNQFGAVHFSFGGQAAQQPQTQRAIPPGQNSQKSSSY
jgi:hypothetical protein